MSKERINQQQKPLPKSRTSSRMATTPSSTSKEEFSHYKKFLENYILDKKLGNKTPASIEKWPSAQGNNVKKDEDLIINELAKKFNKYNEQDDKLGIGEIHHAKPSMYGVNLSSGKTYMQLSDFPSKAELVAHELVHANDHQIDALNPKVWNNLETLFKSVGQDNFNSSLKKIQNKLNPAGDFKKNYSLNSKYLQEQVKLWNEIYPQDNVESINPKDVVSDVWTESMFKPIQTIVNKVPPSETDPRAKTMKNPPFLAGFASEFPAFALERLTENWRTDKGNKRIEPLNDNEQQFLHNTLSNLNDSYPKSEYPTINNYINKRKDSIEATDVWNNQKEEEAEQQVANVRQRREKNISGGKSQFQNSQEIIDLSGNLPSSQNLADKVKKTIPQQNKALPTYRGTRSQSKNNSGKPPMNMAHGGYVTGRDNELDYDQLMRYMQRFL